MKKNFNILKIAVALAMVTVMILSLVACAGGATSSAADANGTYGELIWTYTKSNQTLTIENENYNAADPSTLRPIPSFKNMDDEAWDKAWADERASIKKVVIKAGISEIGNYAFAFCTNLEEVSVPQTVTAIGESAFEGTALKKVDLPSSVTTINHRAFYATSALESVKINGDLEFFGIDCFKYCPSLKNVYATEAVFDSGVLEVIRSDNPNALKEDGTHRIMLHSMVPGEPAPEVKPPVEQETEAETTPETTVDTAPETTVDTGKGDEKVSGGTIAIIVIMALILIALVVAIIMFIRYDKKHSGNTTTVRKNDKKDDNKKSKKK